jgi:glutaredoxin
MDKYMQKPGKKFIIFGARWCGPCKFIRRLVRQMDFKYQIMWVDVDTEWGGILWQRLEKNTVPILVEIDKRGELVGTWTDARGIVMHLLLVE